MKTIAIIGGGAAGMMTAATLLEQDTFSGNILLFEKNSRLGAKVIISGGGRCNVTTGVVKRKDLKTYYTRGAEFLDTAFRICGPRQVRSWFEEHGVPLKQEDDGRIFPVSDNGKDIVGVFEKLFSQNKQIEVKYGESVIEIKKEAYNEGEISKNKFCITTSMHVYDVDVIVLTTGGNAYAHTGSSGDGYTFARACGHTITPLGPSLNSFMTQEKRLHELSGLSFQNAALHVKLNSGEEKIAIGPVLLTHFGISGPAVFVIASHAAFEEVSHEHPLQILLQPIAGTGVCEREKLLLDVSISSPKKELHTVLTQRLPKRFISSLLAELDILSTIKISVLSKEQRSCLVDVLGNGISLHAIKRRPGDEFVTAGGVSLDEIDHKTMQSKICPGLYFAGEIMDVDGVTGGYNLQASWAAGRLVGKSIG